MIEDEFFARKTGGLRDNWRRECQPASARSDVALPAAPHQRVAPSHQEPVAGVLCGRRIVAAGRAVELDQRPQVSAIVDVVEQRAVAFGEIGRLEDQEVGRVFDLAARIARRALDVDDAGIERMRRVELAVETANHLLVRTDLTERLAGSKRFLPRDLDPRDARLGGCDAQHERGGYAG